MVAASPPANIDWLKESAIISSGEIFCLVFVSFLVCLGIGNLTIGLLYYWW